MEGYQRRFGGIRRLLSDSGTERLRAAHVCVVGLGGVGSWAVEALARSGIGKLTLVDLDDVCISNVSRQLHALDGDLGKPKVDVMARRVKLINPECEVNALQSFFLKSNESDILGGDLHYVVDAIDSPSLKAVLIAGCARRLIPVITAGGAGGRQDPTALEVTDVAFASHDRLLAQVRRLLRRHHAFPRGDQPFGVECVLSREPVVYARTDGSVCTAREAAPDLRLDCETGYGTASFVTGAFGLVAASRVVRNLASGKSRAADAIEAVSPEAELPRAGKPSDRPLPFGI
jgi:tRNA A37 threonylcarbamoyladenosine dehydratase